MKIKRIVNLVPLFGCLFISSVGYAEDLSSTEKCERYEKSALAEGKVLPENFLEVCELLETFEKVEAIVEAEKAKSEENALLVERQKILGEILDTEVLIAEANGPRKVFFEKNKDSVLDREVRSPGAAIEVNASTSKNNVAFQVGQDISSFLGENNARFLTWSLRASSPTGSQDSTTTIATLDGLANSTKLALNLNHFFLTNLKDPGKPENKKDRDTAFKICKLIGKENGCSTNDIKVGLKNPTLNLSTEEQEEIFKKFKYLFYKPNSWNFGYNLNAEVGYENFEFIDSTTQEKQDQSETPWSVGASFSVNPPIKFPLLFKLGFKYQEAFKASSSQIVCPPSNGTDSVTCNNGIFSGPNQRENLQLSFETRSILKGSALSLLVTHDFENDETGIDLPIYIVSDKKGNLNGGLRFGWTSVDDDDDFSAGVFVGSNFKFFD